MTITRGTHVPFIVGVPSVRAEVVGHTEDNERYILRQTYDTQNNEGEWIRVTKIHYKDKKFISDYWCDTVGPSSESHGN